MRFGLMSRHTARMLGAYEAFAKKHKERKGEGFLMDIPFPCWPRIENGGGGYGSLTYSLLHCHLTRAKSS